MVPIRYVLLPWSLALEWTINFADSNLVKLDLHNSYKNIDHVATISITDMTNFNMLI